MAEQTSSFNEYVTEGSKLSEFSSVFATLEKMGQAFKKVSGLIESVKNLEFLDTLKDNFQSALNLNERINDKLKSIGFTDKSIGILNSFSMGLLSSADPFVMSAYGTIETFARTALEDVVSSVMSKIYIPDDVFLLTIKGLAHGKSDPNYRNVLREACLRHDLSSSIEWLDNFNSLTYTLQTRQTQDALTASRYGSFNVATYIIKKLKETYTIIKATRVFTEDEENDKALELHQYELFFNSVLKNIFVYSYDNLKVDTYFRIIKNFPTFTPSCLGTTDETYGNRTTVSGGDIETIAPLKKFRQVDRMWNEDSELKTFIVPRNNNIKKLYVYLAFSTDYNDNSRLINKPLHDRLKYKMLSTLDESLYKAQEYLVDSPFGKFVSSAKENYMSLIAKYVQKTEKYLFDPKKQDMITGEDTVVLPDFRPAPSKEEAKNVKELPQPAVFGKYNVTYDDFEIYFVDPDFTKEKIVQDGILIIRRGKFISMTSIEMYLHSPEPGSEEITINLYFIYYNSKFNAITNEGEKRSIINFVMGKYIIDYYMEAGLTLETIAAMFPELNKEGIFNEFIDYYNQKKYGSSSNDGSSSPVTGADRNIEDINFYTQVMNEKGEVIKIENTGMNSYNIFGEKITTFSDLPGSPVGIGVVDDDTYALSFNTKTGDNSVYYSPDGGVTWIKMDVNGNSVEILPGVGITSLNQINFFESIYYNNYLFIIDNNKIYYSLDKVNFTELPISFAEGELILGLSILPNGDLYILTTLKIYVIKDFAVGNGPYTLITVSENDGEFTIIKGVVGTILTAVSIPLNTIDDFDIDDKEMINKILQYYNSSRLIYYWYSTESEITGPEIFIRNRDILQEKYDNTNINDTYQRNRLQRLIDKQNQLIEIYSVA